MRTVLVCLAVVLLAPVARVREPSWPMAVGPGDERAPVRVVREAPRRAPMAVPEDRSTIPAPAPAQPRVVLPPEPGWPGASVDPGPRM
jgi:hypothetical protein